MNMSRTSVCGIRNCSEHGSLRTDEADTTSLPTTANYSGISGFLDASRSLMWIFSTCQLFIFEPDSNCSRDDFWNKTSLLILGLILTLRFLDIYTDFRQTEYVYIKSPFLITVMVTKQLHNGNGTSSKLRATEMR